jgi:hypothetical protein
VAELISDLIEKPLSATPYQDLCKHLISEFEESESRKVEKLMDELELSDKKHMINLNYKTHDKL